MSRTSIRDAAIDLELASARLTASGSVGNGTEALTFALDAPRLGELAPLLPPRVPRPLSGTLRANADDARATSHAAGSSCRRTAKR